MNYIFFIKKIIYVSNISKLTKTVDREQGHLPITLIFLFTLPNFLSPLDDTVSVLLQFLVMNVIMNHTSQIPDL